MCARHKGVDGSLGAIVQNVVWDWSGVDILLLSSRVWKGSFELVRWPKFAGCAGNIILGLELGLG